MKSEATQKLMEIAERNPKTNRPRHYREFPRISELKAEDLVGKLNLSPAQSRSVLYYAQTLSQDDSRDTELAVSKVTQNLVTG